MGLIAIFHRPDIDFVIVFVRSNPLDEHDLMPVANGDNEPVIVAFGVEYDSIRSDDAGVCVRLQQISRRVPLGSHRFVEPGIKSCFDGSVVLAAFEAFDELSESLSGDDPHRRVQRVIRRLYDVPKMGTSIEFTDKQQRVRGNGATSGGAPGGLFFHPCRVFWWEPRIDTRGSASALRDGDLPPM